MRTDLPVISTANCVLESFKHPYLACTVSGRPFSSWKFERYDRVVCFSASAHQPSRQIHSINFRVWIEYRQCQFMFGRQGVQQTFLDGFFSYKQTRVQAASDPCGEAVRSFVQAAPVSTEDPHLKLKTSMAPGSNCSCCFGEILGTYDSVSGAMIEFQIQ